MAKAKQRFRWSEKPAAGTVSVLDTATDETRSFDFADLPSEIQDNVKCYGIKKVVQDRESGTDADAKLDGYVAVWDMLCSGTWEKERSGGGLGVVPAYITLMEQLYDLDTFTAQLSWKASSDDAKAQFLSEHADEIDEIKASRAATEVKSLDDLA